MSKIYFDDDTDRRIEFDRLLCNSWKEGGYIFEEEEFRRYIFLLGLMDFEFRILPEMTGKPYKPYYSLQRVSQETTTEYQPLKSGREKLQIKTPLGTLV